MLSRLYPSAGSRSLLKCIGQFQVPAAFITTSPVQNQSGQSSSGKIPRPVRLEYTPETRFGFLPKSWFDFMYPKTGVTGPYMLMTGLGTYLLSKEIMVLGPEFTLLLASVVLVTFIQKVYGNKIFEYGVKEQQKIIDEMDAAQNQSKQSIIDSIENLKDLNLRTGAIIKNLPEAKRENVYLQMEAAYRARLNSAFTQIKNRLDYQLEKQIVERRIAQKNMVDYIIKNVEASISSQLKMNAMKQCISDLKNLSTKAK